MTKIIKTIFYCIVVIQCCLIQPLYAEEVASEIIAQQSNTYDPYTFNVKQIILPVSLIAAASTALFIDKVDTWDKKAQSSIVSDNHVTCDNWFQYAPLATMWILDIFGVESQHRFAEQTTTLAVAVGFNAAMVNIMKYSIDRKRPDSSSTNSFPSGHTATAFMSAEFLRMEYRNTSPWIGVSGYCFAIATGYLRVYNGRHYVTDVIAGAGVGILSVKMAYWLSPAINKWIWGSDVRTKDRKRGAYKALCPYATGDQYGLSLAMRF